MLQKHASLLLQTRKTPQGNCNQLQTCMHMQTQLTTTQYTLVTVKTLSSKAQSKLGSLLSSPSCRKLLSQVSKTPAFAENFCSKPKRPATNQILLRTAKTSQDCRKLRKQLGSSGYSHRTTSAAQMLTFPHPLSMGISSFPAHHHRCMSKWRL